MLTNQLIIAKALGYITTFIAVIFIVKKLTKWRFPIATAVTTFAFLLRNLTHAPFEIVNCMAFDLYAYVTSIDSYTSFKGQSIHIKLILGTMLMAWRSLTHAIASQWSFKIITYFDKKRTYNFGIKFFLYLLIACTLPELFTLIYIFIKTFRGDL